MNTETSIKQGAHCTIIWRDTGHKNHVYISFSDYDEENDCDGFGIDDDEVFFYTSDYEGFLRLLEKPNGEDFIVLTYEIEQGDE